MIYPEIALNKLQQQSKLSHNVQDYNHYQHQLKSRAMLLRYQQGLNELFNDKLTADLTINIDSLLNSSHTNHDSLFVTHSLSTPLKPQQTVILALWQALHLQQLLPILTQILGTQVSGKDRETVSYYALLQAGISDITAQLDPSKQVFAGISAAKQTMLIIFAYRLASASTTVNPLIDNQITIDYTKSQVKDLKRYARLIDIDLSIVSDANLQWLLLTAQQLNSVQLLAIITSTATNDTDECEQQQHNNQQKSEPIAYNGHDDNEPMDNNYRLWLITLHTLMLHDTIVSQDEYDCLTLLAERWLGVQ